MHTCIHSILIKLGIISGLIALASFYFCMRLVEYMYFKLKKKKTEHVAIQGREDQTKRRKELSASYILSVMAKDSTYFFGAIIFKITQFIIETCSVILDEKAARVNYVYKKMSSSVYMV